MSETSTIIHFTFGSPQNFISQARRTRDLWAGSYLLSWLCGQALKSLLQEGGKINLPSVDKDALFSQIQHPKAITPHDTAGHLGSIPTRFSATIPSPDEKYGNACRQAINDAWAVVAGSVHDLLSKPPHQIWGEQQNRIWDRQTKDFWECVWVIGNELQLLEQRKNTRTHLPAGEPGAKCTVCGIRQELSGRATRTAAATWWIEICNREGIHQLDLSGSERLCAVCLIKRLFPKVAGQSIGWKVPEFYPSTNYISAIDWINQLLDLAKDHPEIKQAAIDLIGKVPEAIVSREEGRNWSPIQSITDKLKMLPELQAIQSMSGSIFHEDALLSDDVQLTNRAGAIEALRELQKTIQKAKPEYTKASPFYALLLMDGDGMGDLFDQYLPDQQELLSKALAAFNQQVSDIVRQHDGWLIYAGGEDVFALLPVSRAFDCARLIREAYRSALREYAPFLPDHLATISAGINFAHMNTALGTVVRDTHRLLDEVAKDRTGRDAVACRIWKRGGPILTWAQPWKIIDDGQLLGQVKYAFNNNDGQNQFSSRFFYKLRDLFELVNSSEQLKKNQVQDLLVTEYLANREHQWPKEASRSEILDDACQRVALLVKLCRAQTRRINPDGTVKFIPGDYHERGALLVRFLAQKEV